MSDTDFDLYDTVWTRKAKSKGLQTDASKVGKALADLRATKTRDSEMQTNAADWTPSEVVYTMKTPVVSPEKNAEEERKQKKFLSAQRAMREALVRRDIQNNEVDLSYGADSLDMSTDIFHDASQAEGTPHKTPAFTKAVRSLKNSVANLLTTKKLDNAATVAAEAAATAETGNADDDDDDEPSIEYSSPGRYVRRVPYAAGKAAGQLNPHNNRSQRRRSAKLKVDKRRRSGSKSINTMDEYYTKVKASATSPQAAALANIPSSRNRIVNWEQYK